MRKNEAVENSEKLSVQSLNKIVVAIECERIKALESNRISDAMSLEKKRVEVESLRDRFAKEGETDELIKQLAYVMKENMDIIKHKKGYTSATKNTQRKPILYFVLLIFVSIILVYGLLIISLFFNN